MPANNNLKLNSLDPSPSGASRYFSGTLSVSSGNIVSVPVMVPKGIMEIACGIVLATPTSSGRIEYTLSPLDNVSSNTANWRAWPAGNVTQSTDDLLMCAVTALRAVCVVGAITYEFVGGGT